MHPLENELTEIEIDDIAAPQLEPYREMRSRNWTEQSGIFVAEGPLLVEQLLSSSYQVRNVLVDRKYYHHYAKLVPPEVELLVIPHELVEQLVGYDFHRGVLACGLRKEQRTVERDFAEASVSHDETLMAVIGVQDPENLGGILRSCAALGIRQVVIGPGTADPLSRRVLRVSIGHALLLQLYRSRDLLADLEILKQRAGIESIVTSLIDGGEPLEAARRHGPLVVVVGNEKAGVPREIQRAADRRVKIEMELGTDSLNVTVAAGIVAHYFCRLAPSAKPAASGDS